MPEPAPPSGGDRSSPVASAQSAKVAILKTADAIRRRAATLLAGRGITFQQYNVLRILRGVKAGPITGGELAERTIEVIADITALLDDLERKGLVRSERTSAGSASDRWSVTSSGLELLEPLDGPVADADRAAISGLDEGEVRSLIALLERVRARA
jgi:DNA-binding MarR family transcriptional regulator